MTDLFFIEPLSASTWEQYRACCVIHKVAEPAVPKRGIWVTLRDGTLVAGLCVYETDGEWVLFEHLVTNPKLSRDVRIGALRFALAAAKAYAAIIGKVPTSMVTHDSIRELLMEGGVERRMDITVFQATAVSASPIGMWLREPAKVCENTADAPDAVDTDKATGVQPAASGKRRGGKERLDAIFGSET